MTKDHKLVMDMLSSAQTQKRLEEARRQREKVLAEREAARTFAPRQVAKPDAHPLGHLDRDETRPEWVNPPTPAPRALLPSRPLKLASDAKPRMSARRTEVTHERRPWAVSLILGLVGGLALGAGVVQLADVSPLRSLVTSLGIETAEWRGATTMPPQAIVSAQPPQPVPPPAPSEAPRPVAVQSDLRPDIRSPAPLDLARVAAERAVAVERSPSRPVGADAWRPAALRPLTALHKPGIPPTASERRAIRAFDEPRLERALPSLAAPPGPDRPLPARATVAPTRSAVPQVTLHASLDLPGPILSDARAAIAAAEVSLAATRTARFGVATSEVRFFHAGDAGAAARVAAAVGADARDFSSYRPVPAPGTLEVWLADGT